MPLLQAGAAVAVLRADSGFSEPCRRPTAALSLPDRLGFRGKRLGGFSTVRVPAHAGAGTC